jgi:hypothetical protein
MCGFCVLYGKEKIEDEDELKKAVEIIGTLKMNDHFLRLIDIWIDGDQQPDRDTEALWERTVKKRG